MPVAVPTRLYTVIYLYTTDGCTPAHTTYDIRRSLLPCCHFCPFTTNFTVSVMRIKLIQFLAGRALERGPMSDVPRRGAGPLASRSSVQIK